MTTSEHVARPRVARVSPRRPRLPGDLIGRPRLLTRLDRAVDGGAALVRAPAGYGKTTLLASWLAAGDRAAAWVSADASHDALDPFVRTLVEALRAVLPNTGKDALALLNLPEPAPPALF